MLKQNIEPVDVEMNAVGRLISEIKALPAPVLIVSVAAYAVYWIVTRIARKRAEQEWVTTLVLLLDVLAVPGLLIGLQVGISDLGVDRFMAVSRTLWAVFAVALAWLSTRVLHRFLWSRHFRRQYGREAPNILRHMVSVALYLAAAGIIVAVVFERSASGVLVSTGVIVGVIGLALQNVLGDLFSGITITLEQPYGVGDWIRLSDGSIGEVTDISWQATHLVSFNNGKLIVPNSYALRGVVHNYSRPTKLHAEWITVKVDRSYEPAVVRRLLLEAALTCRTVKKDPTPVVNVSDASGNPIEYLVYVYFPNYVAHFGGKNDLYMNIHAYLGRAGIAASAGKYEVSTEPAEERTLQMPSLREELAGAEIFSMLSEEQIDVLADCSTYHTYHPDEVIVQQGSEDNSLLIITSGVVRVTKDDERGRPVEIARLGSGDIIGEMSLLTGERRSATVTALVQVTLIQVTKEDLEPILKAAPTLSDKFAEVMLQREMDSKQFLETMRKSNKATSDFVSDYLETVVRRIRRFFRL